MKLRKILKKAIVSLVFCCVWWSGCLPSSSPCESDNNDQDTCSDCDYNCLFACLGACQKDTSNMKCNSQCNVSCCYGIGDH